MIIREIILLASTAFLFSCNSEYTKHVEQGAKNWCEYKAADKALKDDPENYDLIEERSRSLRYFETNKELSGDEVQFEKDIKELIEDC